MNVKHLIGYACLLLLALSLVPMWNAVADNPQPSRLYYWDGSSAAVSTSGFTTIGNPVYALGNCSVVTVTVTNAGTNSLDDFKIEVQSHPDESTWVAWLSDTDFDTATSTLLTVSATGPHELGASGVALFQFRMWSAYAVRFSAQAVTGDGRLGSVSIYAAVASE